MIVVRFTAHVIASVVVLFGLMAMAVAAQQTGPLVLTSLQSTYSLTSALAQDTSVRVENAPMDGARMAAQERVLFAADLDDLFSSADAVVTIARVWREDRLYQAARSRNIRIVPIDAARPWDEGAAPVGVRTRPCSQMRGADNNPCTDEMSPFVWLSIANGVRMAENIATDLVRLAPEDAEKIQMNLSALVDRLRVLKSEYDNRFVLLPDPRVFALADEFVYLFGEMGIFVDGTFTKEDVRWTEDDLQAFENYLAASGPTIVVHKWEPGQPILDVITRGGGKLVILDPGDPGLVIGDRLDSDGYQTILRNNFDALLAALSE